MVNAIYVVTYQVSGVVDKQIHYDKRGLNRKKERIIFTYIIIYIYVLFFLSIVDTDQYVVS